MCRHVEGESTDTNLVELPSDLFFSMGNLHTIHLSYHANLPSLPSMVGLKTLESVYFGYLDSIKEIPSTGDLPEIQVMALEGLPLVRSLPDVAQYESTLDMMFVQDVPVCCSGFLSEGDCNTTFPSCCEEIENRNGSNTGSSLPPTCLVLPDEESLLPTNATLSFLSQFAVNVSNFCEARQATCPNAVKASKRREKDTCQGVLYRECLSQSQGTGICFNEDMGRVECTYSQSIIEMREAEIAAGCSCDEVEEQWLGCTA
ncbi:Leucine-rich repeat domain, L domain-like [Phytophthora cactorum]|nr:Leucine-rich repeat domain, L domain-like [Phytophthora cactorum]KAF1794802.1 Leucine-rich repeat domain, L domain-like [Phytophthora cactorum]